MEQEETLCDEVETVEEFTCLGDRVSAGGGCEGGNAPRFKTLVSTTTFITAF